MRLGYLFEFSSTPLFHGLVLDEKNYDAWALRIAGGDLMGKGPFTANPFMPYLLGLFYAVVGHNLWFVRIVQAVIGSLTCLIVHGIAFRLFERRAARLAMLFGALYGPAIFLSANLVGETWAMFFAAAAIWIWIQPFGRPPRYVGAGFLFGLAILARPNMMAIMPFLPLAATLARGSARGAEPAKRGLSWFAGVCLVLGPVAARNYAEGGEFVLITAHDGVNLWIGNNKDADGFFKTPRGSGLAGGQESLISSSIRVASRAEGRTLSPKESSRYWRKRALDFLIHNPRAALTLELRKLAFYLNAFEKSLESNYYYGKRISLLLRTFALGFGFVGALGLAGMIAFAREIRRLAALYAYVLIYSGTVLMTFVSMRYRLPVIIGVLPFAGAFVSTLLDTIAEWKRSGPPKRLRSLAAILIGSLVVVNLPIAKAVQREDLAHTYYLLGNVAGDEKRYDDALRDYEKAVELYPDWHVPYNNLGLAHIRVGEPKKAIEALQRAVDLNAGTSRVYRNMGKAYEALGQKDDAIKAYEKAAARGPSQSRNWLLLGRALEQAGRLEEARGRYAQGLERVKSEKGKQALRRAIQTLKRKARGRQGGEESE